MMCNFSACLQRLGRCSDRTPIDKIGLDAENEILQFWEVVLDGRGGTHAQECFLAIWYFSLKFSR
jgi:hypothetical protein